LTYSACPSAAPLGPAARTSRRTLLVWAQLRRLRPVLLPVLPVRSQCAALAALAILAITCEHGNLCPILVPSRSYSSPGSTQQRNTDIEGHKHRYRSTKLRYRIQISKVHLSISRDSSISVYNDVEVLNFDIDVSSISYYIDIEVLGFDIGDSSISYWVDIECFNLRYRRLSDLRHSISNVKTFDIEL
jgi:hypothetical protein